ncbi:MAG: SIS domain-containing protein [Balneolaceae bacterium]
MCPDKNKVSYHTINEIQGQPGLWKDTFQALQSDDSRIRDFLTRWTKPERLQIVLTGAGSSAYIGESVEHLFRFHPGVTARAVSTTTLVTHFKNHVDPSVPLLLISFARSGNSPESMATVDIAEKNCDELHHIAITCNPSGQLAQMIGERSDGLKLVLPPASEDQGLAMTGSFTAMMLTAIYLSKLTAGTNASSHNEIEHASEMASQILKSGSSHLKSYAEKPFRRIIFLGSGPLKGIARESQLKVQELTDGSVVGKYDSFLGFRHGPKAVIDSQTLVVFLFSPDEDTFRYEKDLAEEVLREETAKACIGIFAGQQQSEELNLNLNLVLCPDKNPVPSEYNLLPYVIPAQLLGYYKSLESGLNPDSPSVNHSISRVVQGVTIYR